MTSKSAIQPQEIVDAVSLDPLKERLARLRAEGETARTIDIRERALQLATLRAPEGASLKDICGKATEIYEFIVSGTLPNS